MTTKQIGIGFILLLLISGIQFYQIIKLGNQVDDLRTSIRTTVQVTEKTPEVVLPKDFSYVLERFKLYNPTVDTSIVVTFLNVVDTFGLREEKAVFDMLIGQILLESSARQFKEDGTVVMGTSGEIGISQIMPSTAISILSGIQDPTLLLDMGAKDFSFAYDKKMKKKLKLQYAVEWLTNVDNNLILWGYIMKRNLDHNGMLAGFVAYNAGTGGMRKFLSKFKKADKHRYIKGIRDTLSYVSENLEV